MKLLYIAPTKIEMNQLDGVAKKIMAHVKVFSAKYDVVLLFRDESNVVLFRVKTQEYCILHPGISKIDILKAAFNVVEKENINCCYIRYPNSDPLFISLLKKMKEKGIVSTIEIPTYPYDAEGKESIKGRIIGLVDRYYRKKLHNYVGRIVTYSDDNIIFGIDTIRTVNGVDFDKVSLPQTLPEDDTIHLCGVATFHQIHGYDRLIMGMKEYYKKGSTRKVVFDVVGYGDNEILEEYKKMVKLSNLEDKVIFHGRLNGKDLDDIYEKASIGVNSLAIHRENLEKESTLKTREYAAKGLPILSSSYIDAFDENDNSSFVCRVLPDDSPIVINDIISFYDKLLDNYDIQSMRETIRRKAAVKCDMPITLKPIVSYFDNCVR